MGAEHSPPFSFTRHTGTLKKPLLHEQDVHTLEVKSQADQTPFACRCGQAAQRELAKAQDLFDDPDHRLDGTLAQTINLLADLGLQFVSHFDFVTGIFSGGIRLFLEEGMPILMVRFPSSGNIWVDFAGLASPDIGFAEIAIIQGDCGCLAYFRSERIQRWNGFLLVIGMIRKCVGNDQQTRLVCG